MLRTVDVRPLYTTLEGPVSTMYAEVLERARADKQLLPGSPGSLALRHRSASGSYWYRRYYDLPGTSQIEDFVGREDDVETYEAMRQRIAAAEWGSEQVRHLRRLGLQVAGKDVARVLIELHNRAMFDAGLMVVGTLAFMSWLNEFGVRAIVSTTQDIDLARRHPLKMAAPTSFLEAMQATKLGLTAIPGLSRTAPSTSLKRPGRDGLRVDLLTHGSVLGALVRVPELGWHAQAVPHYDYLLSSGRRTGVLAGGACIPVQVPAPERFAWHKVYSSTRRLHDTAKAKKDITQAATLLAILVEQDGCSLHSTVEALPEHLLVAARGRLDALRGLMAAHPQALDEVERSLGVASSSEGGHAPTNP